ncbi:MAG: DUF1080 domain-containing protein [Sphingobacteriaceae bacterium]|nr:DUF1080 domain-containing protein [Cytophagaceae bacterium]
MKNLSQSALLLAGCLTMSAALKAQDTRAVPKSFLQKPEQSESWNPEVLTVNPPAFLGAPPGDALVLFNGKNLDNWVSVKDASPAKWELKDGLLTVVKGAGNISTKQNFIDFQLHLEWRVPVEPETVKGQEKGNSGVFLLGLYEVQILNSFQNRTYRNGQAGSIYKQSAPLANVTNRPGGWNSYDIIFTSPRFRFNGSLETPGYVTVLHNGVAVQNHLALQGTTEEVGPPKLIAHGPGPISLQDHGNAVSFRNIWIRDLYPKPARPAAPRAAVNPSAIPGADPALLPATKPAQTQPGKRN